MNGVREVVPVAVFLEVWHELVQVGRVGAERATRRQVDVSDDLIDAQTASDVAALARLVLQLVRPTFITALHFDDPIRQLFHRSKQPCTERAPAQSRPGC